MRRALQHDDSRWLAALLPGALDIPVSLSHVLIGACSVGATSCSRLLIEAKADIYEQVPPEHLGAGDTALNVALKTYSHPEDDRMRAGARACALMLLECSPGFGDKDPFLFSSEHALDLVASCAPMDLHGQFCSVGMLPAVQLLLAARVDPNVAVDYNALIRDRVADDEGEHDGLLFEEGSVLPLVVACKMGSPPEVINALLAAGAKPKPAINAACDPRYDLDGKSSQRLELIMHAKRTRELRGRAVEAQGLENRPELNGCRGTIAGEWAGLGRWPVRMVVDDKVLSLSLKCENVVLLPKDERQIQREAPTCAGSAGPGQDSACEDRESPLATSTTAQEDSMATAEDDGGERLDVEDALAADGDISYQRDALQMLLLLASKLDDPKSLRGHLMNGASVDFVDAHGYSPLFHAVALGHEECVKVLLDAKAPVDPELVCYAVEHPSTLALLLDANASPNGPADKVHPPLILAGVRGQSESMQMLLAAGARCDSDGPEDAAGDPAWARLSVLLDQNGVVIDQWHTECLHLLMQRDEQLHSKALLAVENHEQLLCAMCLRGSPTGIKTLLTVGTNPDAIPTGFDAPPLVFACIEKSSHQLECVRVLLHGAQAGHLCSRALCLYIRAYKVLPRTPLLVSPDPACPRLVQAAPTLRSSSTAVSSRPSLPPPRTSPSRTAMTAASG